MGETEKLQSAVELLHAGQIDEAQLILLSLVRENPKFEMAWMWLAESLPDPADRIRLLEECLQHIPESPLARNGLALLKRGSPPAKPPPLARQAGKNGAVRKPPKSKMWLRLGCLVLLGLASVVLLAGVAYYLFTYGIALPPGLAFLQSNPTQAASLTATETPTRILTITPTRTPLPSNTPTQTKTRTPSRTPTETMIQTPTLYQGTPGPDDRTILYLASGGCTAMSVSTSGGSIPLTGNPPEDCGLAEISPDGSRLAYVGQTDPSAVYVINLDGSNRKLLVRIPLFHNLKVNVWNVKWSPNSSRIAIVTDRTTEEDPSNPQVSADFSSLYTIAANGSGGLRKINISGFEQDFANELSWSPDGKWIFLYDSRSPTEDASFYPSAYRESDSLHNYIDYPYSGVCFVDDCHFDWSPDSKTLAYIFFTTPMDSPSGLLQDRQQAITLAQLTETDSAQDSYIALPIVDIPESQSYGGWSSTLGARWSPDGKEFLAYQTNEKILTILGMDGTIQRAVLSLPEEPLLTDWSPDGEWIYFVLPGSATESGGILEIVRADGTDARVLAYGVHPYSIVWK